MSFLVAEFIINPVLRQARRFSEISRSTFVGDVDCSSDHHDAISEASHPEPPVPIASCEPTSSVDDAMAPPESPRPHSASTQETRVDETMAAPMIIEGAEPHDHLGFPRSPRRTRGIPEDDGMHTLRTRIQDINARDISPTEKARLMHETLTEKYRTITALCHVKRASESSDSMGHTIELMSSSPSAQPLDALKFWHSQVSDSSETEKFILSDHDMRPTFVPVKQHRHHGSETPSSYLEVQPTLEQPLGCQHYERNVKLQCSTCQKWYTCRFCHDANEDHNLIRTDTKNMLCMLCATPQRASDTCINCGEMAGTYFCSICKLWENRSARPIYHCNDCGICRRGIGLGKDFFHCKTCRACISTSIESSHKCIERSTDCDCPICGEYLFTSPRPVVFMACGHSIHKKCYEQHMTRSYKCPICNKSLANMESQFRNLDVAIQGQPMPPEFRDTTAVILCNDCSGRSTVSYHWLGLKCSICRSYNTVELQILGGVHRGAHQVITERGEEESADNTNTAATQTREPTVQNPPTTMGPGPQPINPVQTRRRHSSHAIEPEMDFRAPDRVARSVSPLNLGFESIMAQLAPESESDSGDDILGLWRGNAQESSGEESESDSDIMSDVEEEEEEDDPNEIVLIGHR